MSDVTVVITRRDEVAPLLHWGWRLARAHETELSVLDLSRRGGEPGLLPIELATIEAAEPILSAVRRLVDELRQASEEADQPKVAAWTAGGPQPIKACLQHLQSRKTRLVIAAKHSKTRSPLALRLLAAAPCSTLLLRVVEGAGERCRDILVPVSGGPHGQAALEMIGPLAAREGAALTALYVEPDSGPDSKAVGLRKLERSVREAGLDTTTRIRPRVAVADDVSEAIREIATEGFDLLVVGASNKGFVRRTLFSTVPERLLAAPEGALSVAVVRAPRPLAQRWREALDRLLERRIPQLTRDDRVALFERLESGSRFGFDFLVLICLSTAIASLGLLQNAAAVVIGAMLVAPLLTPMIGAGLALVQGNVVLIKSSARSIVLGFVLALAIGFVMGLVTPLPGLTAEMRARGAPNLLDLGIAFFSGVAAAYAVARPNLSGALPGVAIAAALVPPIATCGASLALGEPANAQGAATLFGTNLVAIVLGASLSLYLVGVRGNREGSRTRLWARRTVMGLVVVALMLAFPLGSVLISRLGEPVRGATPVTEQLYDVLAAAVAERTGGDLREIERQTEGDQLTLRITIEAPRAPSDRLARALAREASRHLERPVGVQLVTTLVTNSTAAPE